MGWNEEISERLNVPKENNQDIEQLFSKINLSYRAPNEIPYAGIEDNSVDIVYSNTTFEHIPAHILDDLLNSTRRVLAPHGVMVHLKDCSDHFSHTDPNISNINF